MLQLIHNFCKYRKLSDPPKRGRSSLFWWHIININMKNIFEKKKFYKIRFVSYSCKSVLIFRFLIEDEKKRETKKRAIFCHCNWITFYIESKILVLPIIQIVNIFIKYKKRDIFHSPRDRTLISPFTSKYPLPETTFLIFSGGKYLETFLNFFQPKWSKLN